MLGLPGTTGVNVRIPKEAFYRNLKMNVALRASFTDDIDRIVVRNSIKDGTINVAPGERVTEIMVLEVMLKRRSVPEEVLRDIAAQNPHKLVFACTFGDECALAVMLKELVVGEWQPLEQAGSGFELRTESIDAVWDSMASQIAYGDAGGEAETVEQRYANDAKLAAMKDELAKLEARRKKEKQFARKNAMFEEARELKARIAAFEEGR